MSNDAEIKLYKSLAEAGDAAAQNRLGSIYQHGEGVPKDDAESVKWYLKAAENGHAEAPK